MKTKPILSSQKGFTLLELTMVLAISAILVWIGLNASRFDRTTIVQEQMEAEKVKQALIDTRNSARFELKCVSVQVSSQSLLVTSYSTCLPVPANPVATKTINFAPIITLGSFDTGSSLTFNAQGGTNSPSPSTLTITSSSSGRTYAYTVMPAIGTISSR